MKTTKLLLFVTFVLAAGSVYSCGWEDCCGNGESAEVPEKGTEPSVEPTKPVVAVAAKEVEQEVEVAPKPEVILAKNEAQEPVTEGNESDEEVEEFDFEEFSKFAKALKKRGSDKKNT